jgi:hypothetical protein
LKRYLQRWRAAAIGYPGVDQRSTSHERARPSVYAMPTSHLA